MPEAAFTLLTVVDGEEKSRIAAAVLAALPQWFAVPASRQSYVAECAALPFWAAVADGEAVGFLAAKRHAPQSAEIAVMGVLPAWHRRGAGRALVDVCIDWCAENGVRFLQVKTLDPARPDPYYARTRAFYEALGFVKLETHPTLWDEANPCLQLITCIER